jgi:mannitol/fructose-specific phosphotransferase system IIA component (Ntr-type)
MNLTDYTTQSGFLPQIKCADLTAAVRELVGALAGTGALSDVDGVVAEIMRREAEGSTAVGDGLVIPHARLAAVRDVHIAIASLARPIVVDAPDGAPADLVVLLVGPTGDPRRMLRVLARLVRMVRYADLLADLRDAATPDDLRQALARADQINR